MEGCNGIVKNCGGLFKGLRVIMWAD